MSVEESYKQILEALSKDISQPKHSPQIIPKQAIKTMPIQTVSKQMPSFKNKFLILGLVTILVCSSVLVTRAAISSNQNIPGSGFIYTVGVGVFADPSCTINMTKIDWGNLNPGTSVTKTAYIKNNGSSNLTISLATTNWQPPIMQQYLSLSWNATNYVLMSGQTVAATFLMSVSADASGGAFSYNSTVTGQGS